MNEFVMTRLKGGLGNQMFQYAMGKSLAVKHKVPLFVDTTFLEKIPVNGSYTKRNPELDVWKIDCEVADRELVNSIRKYIDNTAFKVLAKLGLINNNFSIISENDPALCSLILNRNPPIYLEGYWQNENFFSEIRNVILSEFIPRTQISDINKEAIQIIQSTHSASVHVRRGDYITVKDAANFHGVCSIEYYHAGIQRLFDQYGVDHFFVFSDDIEWTKGNVIFPCNVTFVDHNFGSLSYWDIWLMSQCKHHIIANSSFSWWGAWLNSSAEKVVIAPKNWFAAGGGENIVPKNWISI